MALCSCAGVFGDALMVSQEVVPCVFVVAWKRRVGQLCWWSVRGAPASFPCAALKLFKG